MSYDAETRRETRRKYRARNVALIHNYLVDHPCVDCGEDEPVVLDFDHIRDVKVANVSLMISNTRSWATIQKEIAKCDVRCSNCHRRRSAAVLGTFSHILGRVRAEVVEPQPSGELAHGIRNGYYRGCRCQLCRDWHTNNMREYKARRKRRDSDNGSTEPW